MRRNLTFSTVDSSIVNSNVVETYIISAICRIELMLNGILRCVKCQSGFAKERRIGWLQVSSYHRQLIIVRVQETI